MKKKALSLHKQLRSILDKNQVSGPDLDQIFDKLKNYCEQLPEKEEKQDEKLPAPSELADFPQGIAMFCDGACRVNPGPGGWGIVAQNAQGDVLFEAQGFEAQATNNRMEMQACIELFQNLEMLDPMRQYSPILIMTDSRYVVDGLTQWVEGWKKRGWRKADNKEPENIDLWKKLDELKSRHSDVKMIWVKGHVGHPQNERCDKLANIAIDENINS